MSIVKVAKPLSSTTVYDRGFTRATVKKFTFVVAVVAISGVALAVRITVPDNPDVNVDEIEYVNIARHLAAGEGYVSSLKSHVLNAEPVIRYAWGERLPGLPIILTFGLTLGGDNGMKVVIAALSITLLLIYLLCFSTDFSPRIALVASTGLILSPNLVLVNAGFYSENLYLPLIVGAVFLLAHEKVRAIAVITGALFGLAALTRPEAVPLFLVSLFLRPRGVGWSGALYSCLGFATVYAPYGYIVYLHTGNALNNFYAWHLVTLDAGGHAVSLGALEPPAPLTFITGHVPGIITGVTRNLYNNVKELAGYKFLSVLAPFAFFSKPTRPQRRYLVVAAFLFLWFSANWSTMDLRRFMVVPYLFIFPFALMGLENVLAKFTTLKARFATAVTIILFGTVVFLYGAAYYANFYQPQDNPVYAVPGYEAAVEFLKGRAKPGEAVMAREAWELNWKTGVPVAVLPIDADFNEAAAWGRKIGVRYLLAGPKDLRSSDETVARFGEWRIYDLADVGPR